MNKYCVIGAIGRSSLHRDWINKNSKFDLHLIVYDDSFEQFRYDAHCVAQSKGNKFQLLDDYLVQNDLADRYDYYYFPDDDILIDSENIHKLFWYMEHYRIAIAQPAIHNYYISHFHTMRRPDSKIRHTTFVEIMQPCFSKEALKRCQFTFSLSISGWGLDFHWSRICNDHGMNMAIIDDVTSVHTRPVRSNHVSELDHYLARYDLAGIQIK